MKILSSSRQSILLEYTPSISDTSTIKIDNVDYLKISLFNCVLSNRQQWGSPSIPERILNLGVPEETGNTIEVISSSKKELSGRLAPVPEPLRSENGEDVQYKIGKEYYSYQPSSEVVSFGEYGLMRNIRTQSLNIWPIKYFPNQNKIIIYTKIVFRVNYSSKQSISSRPAGDFLKGALVNYEIAKYWNIESDNIGLHKLKVLQGSVLTSGTWGRFDAPYEGIYKITKSMLPALGINPDSVDPTTIKIYNNGGKILPESVTASRPEDLVENSILFVGNNPNHFGDNDYILFYGRGSDFWDYDSTSNSVIRFHNPYSNHNYYWITSGGAPGKRMLPQASLSVQGAAIQTTSAGYAQWDEDKINIGKTGREYFGDGFSQNSTSMTYTEKLPSRISGSTINYQIRFANTSQDPIGLKIEENSTTIYSSTLYGYGNTAYLFGIPRIINTSYNGNLTPDNRSQLKFTVTPYTVAAAGYLDYFEISYQKNLTADGNNLLFYSNKTNGTVQYNLTGFTSSEIKIFNISDYSNVKLITNPSINAGNCSFQASENEGYISKYYAVGSDSFFTPANLSRLSNPVYNDLRQSVTGAKFIIITTHQFQDAAERLKNYRANTAKNKISTAIVYIEDIYNQFSCGSVDPTAMRDFIRYAYNNWQIQPQYILFFGKGTYDPKNVEGYNNDYIPTYQTEESLQELYSYPTDDYFVEVSGNDNFIDLAYGRIPAMNDEQANDIVTKIIDYENNSDQGAWRDLITLVADDGWHGSTYEGTDHTDATETLANYILPSSLQLNKIYLAAYPVVLTSVGRRIPDANKAIINAVNDGTVILNYIGHGAPDLWADERVFVQSTTIPQFHNNRYFFLSAATCDFARFDVPNNQSSTEELLFQKNAGCIAGFSASRPVFSSSNHDLINKFFYSLFYSQRDSLDQMPTIGQVEYITKQTMYQDNDQKYEIFGDPTMRILLPQYNASVDSVNGSSLASPVQIKALSNVKISGEILTATSRPWTDFNGTGILSVYDSQRQVALPALDNYVMTASGGLIFRGRVSVINGTFNANFVVPKDISYENKSGKILFYFFNNSGDGIAYTTNIIVGGSDTTAPNNKIGPDINIFFDDTTYANSMLINPNSVLIVKLYDNNGLNTTGTGVGHKMEGILNDDINNPIDFTNYFTGDLNAGGKSGEINYRFTGMNPGNYKLKVTAWDVFNNFSAKTTNFTVVDGEGLTIKNVFNYPDPFRYGTTFTFQQNVNKPINVKIRIFSVAGRLVREIEQPGLNEKFVKVNWDGRDQDGDLLANGTYLYKIVVQTVDGNYSKSVLGKLAIIR